MSLAYRARINGAIDTSNNVLDNINKIATSSGCYVTWDPSQGKWTVVINDVGTSVFSFNDSNIISPITLSTSNIDQLYNRVTVQFPHQDLRDSIDTTTFRIPDSERYNGETDNPLNINLELCNDPVQAQLIAARELKQSRVDKVVTFTADYTANGLLAGEIISITNSAYGWTNKRWRVISIEEQDGANGELLFGITAQEYDAAVYNTSGLVREERTTETEIRPSQINQCILDENGNEIANIVAENPEYLSNLGFSVVLSTGSVKVSNLPQTGILSGETPNTQVMYTTTFTSSVSGTVSILTVLDQNGSGALGGRGSTWSEPLDTVTVALLVQDSNSNNLIVEGSGGFGTFFWTDYTLSGVFNVTKGETYTLIYGYGQHTESDLSATADFTIGWIINTVNPTTVAFVP
jgi:hypothetical protein